MVLLLVAGSPAAVASPGTIPSPCERIAFSPSFHEDGTAFCAARELPSAGGQDPVFSVTKDHGRTWRRTAATGLVLDEFDGIGQLEVSPLFPEDGAAYLATGRGLWRTGDLGESFELVYSLSLLHNSEGLTPFVTPGAPPVGGEPAFALANYSYSGLITPPLYVPVGGSPLNDHRFLVSPKDPTAQRPLAIAYRNYLGAPPNNGGPVENHIVTSIFECTPGFTCERPLFEFPTDLFPHDSWYGADGSTIYIALAGWIGNTSHRELWFSEDGGASFRPWDSVNKLLAPVNEAKGFEPGVGLATHPEFPQRMYLRISSDMKGAEDPSLAPPGDQIFRSNDGGRSWKRVAFGWYTRQEREGGAIPWTSANAVSPSGKIWLQGDGTLYVIGTNLDESYKGVYCSSDNGRSWAKTCK